MDTHTISLLELRKGVELCSEHVDYLIKKAQKEYENKEYPLAYFLAFTAYEEYAKAIEMFRSKKGLKEDDWIKLCTHDYKLISADQRDKEQATKDWKKKYPEDGKMKIVFKKQPEIYAEEIDLRNDSIYFGYNFNTLKWKVPKDIKDIDVRAGFKIGDALRLRALLKKGYKLILNMA